MKNAPLYFIPLILFISFLMVGCVFVPKSVPQKDQNCKLSTKSYTLDVIPIGYDRNLAQEALDEMSRLASSDCDKPACLMAVAPILFVSAGSFIVSGSVAIAGNTIHWIEKEGSCENGVIKKSVLAMQKSIDKTGGYLLGSGENLINWFKKNLEL